MNRDLTTTLNLRPDHGAQWQLRTYELKTVMGCTPGPKGGLDWPPEGLPGKAIGNVWVRVNPRGTTRRAPHRAIATCPACSRDIPAGRLHQHLGTKACQPAVIVAPYYTLAIWQDSAWSPEYGSYDRAECVSERLDYRDHYIKAKHLRILRTTPDQTAIMKAVSKLPAPKD